MHKVGTVWPCYDGGRATEKYGALWDRERGKGHTYWLTYFKSRLPPKKKRKKYRDSNDNSSWFISLKVWPMRGYKLVFIIFGIVVAALRECQPKTQNVHKQIGLVYGGREHQKKVQGKNPISRAATTTCNGNTFKLLLQPRDTLHICICSPAWLFYFFSGVLMDVWHAKEFIGRLIDGPHIDLRAQRIRVRSVGWSR